MADNSKEKFGFIWDLDGTIADSVRMYYESYRSVFAKYELGPLETTLEEYRLNYFGTGIDVFLHAKLGPDIPQDKLDAMVWDYTLFADEYLTSTMDGGVKLIPGVDRVIKSIFDRGYPLSIASTSWTPTIVHTLEKLGLLNYFSDIASGKLLPPKPAPDVYQLSAALINVPPSRCVVFEDSKAGMRGAKNAGMLCVGIATALDVTEMKDADIRLRSWDEFDLDEVLARFA